MAADRELIAIEEVAAQWMVERDRGFLDGRETEFARWLAADPRHRAAFNALAETWNLLGEMRPLADDADRSEAATSRRGRVWLASALAAAAALAVASLGWWRTAGDTRAGMTSPFAVASATEIGMQRTVALPDGSVIHLNTDSAVDVHYTAAERRVALVRGEAHFTVARNTERPFIVSVAGVDVRVVGTVFNVRLRPESVDVLVTEGKVRVAPTLVIAADPPSSGPPRSESDLTAGQKMSIGLRNAEAPETTRAELSTAEIKQALAWQSRRLDFDATPLRDIVAEINRYNRHKLVIADARLEDRRFGGSFPAGDYATIVRMLEANFGVVAERRGEETRLRLKSP